MNYGQSSHLIQKGGSLGKLLEGYDKLRIEKFGSFSGTDKIKHFKQEKMVLGTQNSKNKCKALSV